MDRRSKLDQLIDAGKTVRAIGFDDAPFTRDQEWVDLIGIVTNTTRFEGMVKGSITRDGLDATEVMADLLGNSKFASQVHVVLTDGLTTGGLNPLDLAELHRRVQVPCIAVMRRLPDLEVFRSTLERVHPSGWERIATAGPIHTTTFVYQCVGCDPSTADRVLQVLTDTGRVPEPLRLAHLVGAAVATGESGKRA